MDLNFVDAVAERHGHYIGLEPDSSVKYKK